MKQSNRLAAYARRLTVLLAGMVLTLVALHGQALGQDSDDDGMVLSVENRIVQHVMEVQDYYTEEFLGIEGVFGIGIGTTESGEIALVLLTERELGPEILPEQIEGIPVVERVAGPSKPIAGTSTSSTTTRYTRPVPIGVSSGNYFDCGAGTIGARVTDGTNTYILSCNHVFARYNAASNGNLIMQPGRSDVSCQIIMADTIGRLADFEPLAFSMTANNTMDAALVQTSASMVANFTPQDGYGIPSSTTSTAFLNQSVQKYGKATGLTDGNVIAINTTVIIAYPAGATRFVNQILVEPPRKKAVFTAGGDSGSLVVTNTSGANPIGLVFAMTGNYTVVTPIDVILSRFNVDIDDGSTGPLPVELTYFSGAMVHEDVHLKWRTETELQNHAFRVQRSTDQDSWNDITEIPGGGTSNVPLNYSFVDAGIGSRFSGEKLFYRLLQIDRDGTENYSSILEIEPLPAAPEMQIYPNPVRSDAVTTVRLSTTEPMDGDLHVYDASGRLLPQYSQHLSLYNGSHVVPLTLSSVTPGSYFLEFRSVSTVVRERMIVIR
ncbi:T9SS type A sorting domain-containing protein [bacterium]|nr:T9SS type A sorting domain-containing protein [bacterium]